MQPVTWEQSEPGAVRTVTWQIKSAAPGRPIVGMEIANQMFSCPKLSSLCIAPLRRHAQTAHILPHDHLPPHTDVIHVVYYIFCDCVSVSVCVCM